MKLRKVTIENYKGAAHSSTYQCGSFSCIVGQNDAGKSTILKALNVFLNEAAVSHMDCNTNPISNVVSICCSFLPDDENLKLGEEYESNLSQENLLDEAGLISIKKIYEIPTKRNTDGRLGKPKIQLLAMGYPDNPPLISLNEKELMVLCRSLNIDTSKGNGEEFNNVEKRNKIREVLADEDIKEYWLEVPNTGSSKIKSVYDALKSRLPRFEYFNADYTLGETGTSIQNHFREVANEKLSEITDTNNIEQQVGTVLQSALDEITNKINMVVGASEQVHANISFEWSKLVSLSFVSNANGEELPLSSRGDGFRRLTMMAYFEYLAESKRSAASEKIIFGFEEPETFLHPGLQEQLYDKLFLMSENNFQVIFTTHSPILAGKPDIKNLVHIRKNPYRIIHNVDYKEIAQDLGIRGIDSLTSSLSTTQLLLLVEGKDDCMVFAHLSKTYKNANLIDQDLEELGILPIPIGGSGSINHWVALNIVQKLQKPFYLVLDSDEISLIDKSAYRAKLKEFDFIEGEDFHLLKKREMENYIPCTAFRRLLPNHDHAQLQWNDYDDVKAICKQYTGYKPPQVGGKSVLEKHFEKLTIDELQSTWRDGEDDEFLYIYNAIKNKIR